MVVLKDATRTGLLPILRSTNHGRANGSAPGCDKSTLGYSLIRLTATMRHIEGQVELEGNVVHIGNDKQMNEFRFKEVSIFLNPPSGCRFHAPLSGRFRQVRGGSAIHLD